jgi:hypothetical protein
MIQFQFMLAKQRRELRARNIALNRRHRPWATVKKKNY